MYNNIEELYKKIQSGIEGNYSGIRAITRLGVAGGQTDKVFPPTYMEGKYALETRLVDGKEIQTVLLDSVQSQANRMERALLKRFLPLSSRKGNEFGIPLLTIKFGDIVKERGGILTVLDVPHGVADAIFRDSRLNGVDFRESDIGKQIFSSRQSDATGLFKYCPTALIFGMWDSHSGGGVDIAKFPRIIYSEIVGFDARLGNRVSSRIDPLGIKANAGPIYEGEKSEWTLDEAEAKKNKNSEPIKYGKGRPSDIGHSNIPPQIEEGKGGVTISYALQTSVISFAALRRLRFPDKEGRHEKDSVVQTLLALLALYSMTLLKEEGYDLRSRCFLVPLENTHYEMIKDTLDQVEVLPINSESAYRLLNFSYEKCKEQGIEWEGQQIELVPSSKLLKLIEQSRELSEAEVNQLLPG